MSSFVYRTFRVGAPPETARRKLEAFLAESGLVHVESGDGGLEYRYPGVTFSSKRPMTCISRLSVNIGETETGSAVSVGITFTKIKVFTVTVMALVCFVLPAVLGYYQHGIAEIPPMSWLGIPLGFLLHFHVRWRVFTRFARFFAGVSADDDV